MAFDDAVFLIGFSGSGKSTVGPLLARRLKTDFIDVDSEIEKKAGKTISAIFSEDGEQAFRRMEKTAIKDLLEAGVKGLVIALGGGAFENGKTRKAVQKAGLVIYLRCSQRELYRRLSGKKERPMLLRQSGSAVRERIRELVSIRSSNYNKANITVSSTNRTATETVKKLTDKLRKRHADS